MPESHPALRIIHIPKTAGSSLNYALARTAKKLGISLGRSYSRESSGKLAVEPGHWSIGHFRWNRLSELPTGATLTFLRHPVAHTWSHYQHMVRHGGFTGGIEDFMKTKHADNLQVKFMAGVAQVDQAALESALTHLEQLDFIGITEHFDKSLCALYAQYNLGQPRYLKIQENPNPSQPTEEQEALMRTFLKPDLILYHKAAELFTQQPSVQEITSDDLKKFTKRNKRYSRVHKAYNKYFS